MLFVNWVLFDNQMNYVSASSGFDQVGNDQEFKKHVLANLAVSKSGYLYIYVNNETPNIDVFFDNLQVTHVRGPMLEEEHYYPFGLAMAGISDKALKTNYAQNNHLYNGKELQNKEFLDGTGLEEYDYGARFYNAQIGRFNTQDPVSNKYHDFSPYQYGANNPIRNIDVNGDSILTLFYNEKGDQTNSIPSQLAQTFEDEYGITLGYNAETHMLYGNETQKDDNEAETSETGTNYTASGEYSQTARSAFIKELGAGHSAGSLIIGYNLKVEKGGNSQSVAYGVTESSTRTAVIDLADFDNGNLKYVSYNAFKRMEMIPTRAANLGRVIEHEFLGHALKRLSDYPNGHDAGPNEVNVGNPIRAELHLPPRASYGSFGLFGNKSDIDHINEVRILDTNNLLFATKTIHF